MDKLPRAVTIENVRVTGATGGENAGAVILVASSSSLGYITLSNVVSKDNQGAGVAFNSTAAVTDVVITNSTIENNGNAGIRIATAVPNFTGLTVSSTTIANNASSGFSYNPSGVITNVGTNFTFTDVTFTTNNTANTANQHDLSFYGFTGNATLTNVSVASSNSNKHAIAFTSLTPSNTTHRALGSVSLTNVTVTGATGKGALTFQGYNDVSGVSLSNVNVSAATAAWGQVILDTTGADSFPLGNTTLKSLVLWNAGNVDATTAIFKHATTGVTLDRAVVADNFQIANQVVDKVDLAALGYVNWNTGFVYVTPLSYVTPNTAASIQRGIDAATAGNTVMVQAGSYPGDVTINKVVTVKGALAGVTGADPSRGTGESIVQGKVTVTAAATLDGFTLTKPANSTARCTACSRWSAASTRASTALP